MKQTLFKSMLCIITALALGASPASAALTNIVELDWQVSLGVRRALLLPEGQPITEGDLLLLTNLSGSSIDFPVESFAGLEYATNLLSIDAAVTPATSFEPLRALPNLRSMYLLGWLQDVTPLLSLTNVNFYNLVAPLLTNLVELAKHPSLRTLGFGFNGMTNADVFCAFTALENLWLYNNVIQDVSPFLKMTNLIGLSLAQNPITNAHLLGMKRNLTFLGLYDIRLTNCAFVTNLTELKFLDLRNNQIADLQPIAGLSKMEELIVSGNLPSDPSFLENLKSLRVLEVSGLRLGSLAALAGATNMEYMDISNNRIQDSSPLGLMPKLRGLFASDNQFTNIAVLTNCPGLRNLYIGRNYLVQGDYLGLEPGAAAVRDEVRSRGGYVSTSPQAMWGNVHLGIQKDPEGLLVNFSFTPTNLFYSLEISADGTTWMPGTGIPRSAKTFLIRTLFLDLWRDRLGSQHVLFRAAPTFVGSD